jgi:hypothetical protein
MVSSFALQKVTFVKKIVSNKKAKFIYRSLIDKIVQNPTDKFLKREELLDIEIFLLNLLKTIKLLIFMINKITYKLHTSVFP